MKTNAKVESVFPIFASGNEFFRVEVSMSLTKSEYIEFIKKLNMGTIDVEV